MKNTQKITITFGSVASGIAVLCIGIIGLHMYLVYMGGQHISTARQSEEEVYFIRNEMVQIAGITTEEIDAHTVTASHLVVAEPMTVSVSR